MMRLYELMKEDLYDGYAQEIEEEVNEMLARDHMPYTILDQRPGRGDGYRGRGFS